MVEKGKGYKDIDTKGNMIEEILYFPVHLFLLIKIPL